MRPQIRCILIEPFAPLALFLCTNCLLAPPAWGNHGPGTSGGGSSTLSGETLRQGGFDLSFRVDYTQFEDVDSEEAEERALSAGNFDGLDYSVLSTFSLSYGITDDLEAGAQIGYYSANDFIDAEFATEGDKAQAESSIGDPQGLTDLYLTLKYRFLKGRPATLPESSESSSRRARTTSGWRVERPSNRPASRAAGRSTTNWAWPTPAS